MIERTGVACAASGKSGGFLALDWCDNTPVEGLARASFALHATLARDLGADYGYRRMDTYMLAARESGRVAGGHRVPAPAWIDGPAVVGGAHRHGRDDGAGAPRPLHRGADRGAPAVTARSCARAWWSR